MIPRLPSLEAALDGRELRLVSAGGPVAFDRDAIDLAIRRADFAIDPTFRVSPFLAERVGPVLARGSSAAACTAEGVEGVLLHAATRLDGWRNWALGTGCRISPSREISFEHFYQALQAAVAGSGAAIGPVALVGDDLVAGTLIAPLGLIPD